LVTFNQEGVIIKMVYGIGVDIIEVERIREGIQKHGERFQQRIFTLDEIDYCLERNRPEINFAARFAAKEAVVKALGTGLRDMRLTDIEIKNDQLGKPMITLHNQAAEIAKDLGIKEVLISLSHTEEYAVAQAVALSKKD